MKHSTRFILTLGCAITICTGFVVRAHRVSAKLTSSASSSTAARGRTTPPEATEVSVGEPHRTLFDFFSGYTVETTLDEKRIERMERQRQTGAAAVTREHAPSVQRGGNRDHRMQVEVLTLRPTGFDPAEIRRPRGRFLLALNNRSRLAEINVVLVRENGDRVWTVKVNRKKPYWSTLVDLPPGRYKLAEAAHPAWSCWITITPQ